MKYRLLLSLVLAVTLSFALISFAAKAGKPRPATQPATTQAAAGKPINKFCAVEQDNPVDPKVPTVTYKGKVIGFCCEKCPVKFSADPKKYIDKVVADVK